MNIEPIAHIHTDFSSKFGIPRQSGVVKELVGTIVFEPEFRQPEIIRGLEGFSYIWLLWGFSESKRENWTATVRPPRLGGHEKVGVFASRAPYRPNNIGLSSVKIDKIEYFDNKGPVITVLGIDMLDNTPIYDIKPYIPYADCHTDAKEGFTKKTVMHHLDVTFSGELIEKIPADKRNSVMELLEQDPRPAYELYEERMYGMEFAGFDIRFKVKESKLTVYEVEKL